MEKFPQKICHIYEKKADIPESDTDHSYALEDHFCFGSVHKAAEINRQIFLDPWSKEYIQNLTYNGYEAAWSFYDTIYHSFSLPYTQMERLFKKIHPYEKVVVHISSAQYANVIRHVCFAKKIELPHRPLPKMLQAKTFCMNFTAAVMSVLAIIFYIFFRRNVAIRTSDRIMNGTDSDFRLVELYKKLREQNVEFIEFVRLNNTRSILQNMLIRKRLVIYHEPFIDLVSLFIRPRTILPKSAYHSALLAYDRKIRTAIKSAPIFRCIYWLLGVKSLWVGSFLDRVAVLALAAKCSGIKTVGIKSGAGTKSYDVYDFVQPYWSKKKLGPDAFGVWSPWWKKCVKKYNKIIAKKSIKCVGLLRPYPGVQISHTYLAPNFLQGERIKILILSEPLTNPMETAPYLTALAQDPRFVLVIKLRPMVKDLFYEELMRIMPEAKSWPKCDGNIFEDGKNADVFLGAHTTALLEASLMGKLSIFIKTQKWGDYFDISSIDYRFPMLADNPEELPHYIVKRIEKESELKTIEKIKRRYFGENRNGAKWAAEELASA